MSDLYRLLGAGPINVVDRGKVAPTGYVTPEQQAMRDRQTAPAPQVVPANAPAPARAKASQDDWEDVADGRRGPSFD